MARFSLSDIIYFSEIEEVGVQALARALAEVVKVLCQDLEVEILMQRRKESFVHTKSLMHMGIARKQEHVYKDYIRIIVQAIVMALCCKIDGAKVRIASEEM